MPDIDTTTPTPLPDRIRLHITPFSPALLNAIIPQSLQPQATGISFHALQTFPERGFGYVELPAMESQKLKKKLNGATLKGAKMRIEEAKPERKRKAEVEETEEDVSARKKARKEKKKKKKREEDVLPGHELQEGRHVKRGWTELGAEKTGKKSTDKKDKKHRSEPSKYTREKELLFKTAVPENKLPLESSEKKAKRKERGDEKEKRKRGKEVVVHEFGKTTKHPSFLRQEVPKGAKTARFEEGRGWVDEDGQIVEAVKPSKRERGTRELDEEPAAPGGEEQSPAATERMLKKSEPAPEMEQEAGHEATSESEVELTHDMLSGEEPEAAEPAIVTKRTQKLDTAAANRIVKHHLAINDKADVHNNTKPATVPADTTIAKDSIPAQQDDSDSSSSEPDSSEVDDSSENEEPLPQPSINTAKEVHPLEALYKRSAPATAEDPSKPKPAPIDTSFSFFDAAADDDRSDVDEPIAHPPQTPHTKRDLEWRGVRSAAPTPDTAAIGRKFSFPFAMDGDESEGPGDGAGVVDMGGEEEDAGAGVGPAGVHKDREARIETGFVKLFWEKRGELNRGWKRRRREGMKVKRQRENRRLSRRVV